MTSITSSLELNTSQVIRRNFDDLQAHQIPEHFPPGSLSEKETHELGKKFLHKFGEAEFAFFQRKYRLTKEESDLIFQQTEDYVKDLYVWGPYEGDPTIADLVKKTYPNAIFSTLLTKEENHRQHSIVELEGKKYFFYNQAFKGPIVDEAYIEAFLSQQSSECRPNFKVLREEGKTIFLMEYMGESPNFRFEDDLRLIIELIVKFSQNKKALDMLPCRLALKDGNLYCMDQKLCYVMQSSALEAFRQNISMLKGKVEHRGYAEEFQMFAFIDRVAAEHELALFEGTLESIDYAFRVPEEIPTESLSQSEKLHLVAAALRKWGTKELNFFASRYHLSVLEQQEAKKIAGERLKENIVQWSENIPDNLASLSSKAIEAFKNQNDPRFHNGKFLSFTNRVGNYKNILTITLDNEIYVVSVVNAEYVAQYESQKEKEHRPDYLHLPLAEDGKVLMLTKFMGTTTIDYSSVEHLELLVDFAMNFSSGETNTIDFNLGNMVIDQGKIYYIDRDLTYARASDPRLFHLKEIFLKIDETLFTPAEQIKSKSKVKKLLRPMLDAHKEEDSKILRKFFFEEWKVKVGLKFIDNLFQLKEDEMPTEILLRFTQKIESNKVFSPDEKMECYQTLRKAAVTFLENRIADLQSN